MNKYILTAAVATTAIIAGTALNPVSADMTAETDTTVEKNTVKTTTVTKTEVDREYDENTQEISFADFDVNNDGLYGKDEVGEKLFYVFDLDGNEVIDNIEWDRQTIYTVNPVEQETFRFVDYNNDGYDELTSYTYERFYKETGLARFDEDKNGLSPNEFIEDKGFLALDSDDSGVIELDEWKQAYTVQYTYSATDPDNYN